MNALTTTLRDFSRALVEPLAERPMEVRRRLLKAMEVYRNEDGHSRDLAIDAIADGRAAYWTMSSYNNQMGCNLVDAVNRGTPIGEAVSKHYAIDVREALDTLVPLNLPAAHALSNAYSKVGTWREIDELEYRRVADMRRKA